MKFFLRILFLVMLTVTEGFSTQLLIESFELFKQGPRVTAQIQKGPHLLRLATKKKAMAPSYWGDMGVHRKGVLSNRSAYSPFVQKRFYSGNAVGVSNDPLTKVEQEELQGRLRSIDAAGDFAIPTTDSGFKHLLALEPDNEKTIISFLNTFVPPFNEDPVKKVTPAPVSIPVLPRKRFKQTFMDAHVVSEKGTHYVIEMQAKRHVYFDERALFYACSTYSSQIQEEGFQNPLWYLNLKPVIAIQVLDYDTNRVRRLKNSPNGDPLITRVQDNPLPKKEFLKHYLMTCQRSAQKIDHLQLVQIELGRVKKKLYPPNKDFTELDWWLSTFKYAGKYTQKDIKEFEKQGIVMPEVIKAAFDRLLYAKWNPSEIREYKSDIIDREDNAVMLEVERAEGEAKGIAKGKAEGIAEGKAEAAREIAKTMLSEKMDYEIIQKATKLSLDEIKSIDNNAI